MILKNTLILLLLLAMMHYYMAAAEYNGGVSAVGGFNGRDIEGLGQSIGKGAEKTGQEVKRFFKRVFG